MLKRYRTFLSLSQKVEYGKFLSKAEKIMKKGDKNYIKQ